MRFSTTQTSLTTPTQPRQNGGSVVYRGVTTGNAATELFIDGQVGRRLVPDLNSGGIIIVRAARYIPSLSNVNYTNFITGYITTVVGGISLLDQDSGTAGSQDNVIIAAQGLTTRVGLINPGVGADNGILLDAVQPVGTTPGFLRLQVRGSASTQVIWEVQADFVEATASNG